MKKIIFSLASIGVIAAVAIGATAAYFSTQTTSTGNTFTAATMSMNINPQGINNPSIGPALVATNLYPGAFVESAAMITNSGTVPFNPEISLSGASDPSGVAPYMWAQVWTNGNLYYDGPLNQFPGYTADHLVLNKVNNGSSVYVAFRLLMLETAPNSVQGATYSVNIVITGHQWNDATYQPSTPVATDANKYVANTYSYNVCGVRQPNFPEGLYADNTNNVGYNAVTYSPYFSFNVSNGGTNAWAVQTVPATYPGGTTSSTYGCTVN